MSTHVFARLGVHLRIAIWILGTCSVLGVVSCLDPLEQANPVTELRSPSASLEVEPGASVLAAAQALDVNHKGVNGAKVAFARASTDLIVFDGSEDADSVGVTTTTAAVDDVRADGLATVRIRALNDAKPGETSVVAIVKAPISPDLDSVSVRIPVRVVAADAGADGGDGGEVASDAPDASDGSEGGDGS